jgi:putative SOS response-associated peptidase YedK
VCNDYRSEVGVAAISEDFADLKINVTFSEGAPNLEPRADIQITDPGAIVRTSPEGRGVGDLVQRRWSWPGHKGKPVYNFVGENREFTSGRCLIIADGFYEFTKPEDPKKKLKDKWLFTKRGEPIFCIAGIWRDHPVVGEAFTMLTLPPGPDIAPFHDRQIAVLDRDQWQDWLDPNVSAKAILRSLPAGSLDVVQVR